MSHTNIIKTDFCVIGAGSAGLSFAAGAVQMGASVVLCEGKKMGGDCLNYGCVPSKALIHASTVFKDFGQVHQNVHRVIAAIAPHDSVERFEGLGVKVIQHHAKFIDHQTVVAGDTLIQAKRFIIATGSRAAIPPIPGLDTVDFLTNQTLFDLKECPQHLGIIGGGPIGIEIAQAFNRLGAKVTLFEMHTILPKDDQECVQQLKEILISEGINILEGVSINRIGSHSDLIQCHYHYQGQDCIANISHLLVAAGRQTNIGSLECEKAGIDCSPQGIKVDRQLRTLNKRIYAIGDCIGGYQFTHVAGYHAGLAIRKSIFGLPIKINTQAIPWVTYTTPELAHVGLSEQECQQQYLDSRCLTVQFSDNDRAQTQNAIEGLIKVWVRKNGKVLGVTILGPSAGELIFPWTMIIQNNLKIGAIVNTIAPYPTLQEINKRVAGQFYQEKIFGRGMRRVVKCLLAFKRY